ncbi:MAG: hypothetical protein ACPGXK_08705 [Phycisphaerae bacterium]
MWPQLQRITMVYRDCSSLHDSYNLSFDDQAISADGDSIRRARGRLQAGNIDWL